MYAYIPLIWKDMVLTMTGPETWAKILLEAGIWSEIEEPLLNKKTRREDLIFALFGATCKKMALSRDDLLRAFGRHFVSFTLRTGNGTFLRSQGCTLPVFLENVNGMHNYMKRDHPDAKFPFIESKYDPVADTLLLTYLSIREGVSPLLLGIIEEIGAHLYGLLVSFVPTAVPAELAEDAKASRAAAWQVSWQNRPGGCKEDDPAWDKVRSPPPRTSFPALHNSLTQFMDLFRSNNVCLLFCATDDDAGAAERQSVDEFEEVISRTSTK